MEKQTVNFLRSSMRNIRGTLAQMDATGRRPEFYLEKVETLEFQLRNLRIDLEKEIFQLRFPENE